VQLWSRIRSARSLPQLRTLLTGMRESRQLEALAARLVAEQRATPPEVLAAQRAEAAALAATMRGGRSALEAAAARQQAGRGAKRGAQPPARGRPPKRGADGRQQGATGEAMAAEAPLEVLRRHLEVMVSELQGGSGAGSPAPQPPASAQPRPAAPATLASQQQRQQQDTPPGSAVAALAALLGGSSPTAAANGINSGPPPAAAPLQQVHPGGGMLPQPPTSPAGPLAALGRALSSLGASQPAASPSTAWHALPTSTAAATLAPAPWAAPHQPPGGWAAAAPQLPAAQHPHDGLLQRLLVAAQRPGAAAAGLSPQLSAAYLLALQRVPAPQQQQQVGRGVWLDRAGGGGVGFVCRQASWPASAASVDRFRASPAGAGQHGAAALAAPSAGGMLCALLLLHRCPLPIPFTCAPVALASPRCCPTLSPEDPLPPPPPPPPQAAIMELLLQAEHYGGAATLAANSVAAVGLLASL
jgi:hypothetical protein